MIRNNMKKVFLKQITLINWRGVKNKTIDFSGHETFIYGANATGKSTIFDSFIWLLFSKDQFDRKDFEITTVENGNPLKKVDAEVSAVLDVDGELITLKKVYHQKWTTPRGQAEEVFKGCENLCFWNDVPLKVGEYQERINSIINETTFKLITNPNFFLFNKDMGWQKQREHLFEMAGSLSDDDIARTNPDFRALLDNISGKSLLDYKREISARRKKLKDELEQIQPRIDQTRKLMPENRDFAGLESTLQFTERRITELGKSISDKHEAQKEHSNLIFEKQNEINSLRSQQQIVLLNAQQKANEDAFLKNQQRRDLSNYVEKAERAYSDAKHRAKSLQNDIQSISDKITDTNIKIGKLRDDWQFENGKEYIEKEGCLVCPVYGHVCKDEEATVQRGINDNNAKVAFNKSKSEKVKSIQDEGKTLSSQVEELKKELSDKQTQLSSAQSYVDKFEKELRDLETQFENTPIVETSTVVSTDLPEWVSLEELISSLNNGIEELKGKSLDTNIEEYKSKKESLEKERDELKASLNDKSTIERYNKEIQSLELQGKDLAQQIADIEQSEFTIAAFNKAKIEECEQRVNSLFSIINFQLFDKTIDGNEFEACIAKNKSGVPISSTNTAEQINAGLDIINALCRFHDVTAPIFIDGRESVNSLIPTESQVINLIVSEDKSLIIK